MRLLYVADGRSPIAVNWIRHFVEVGHEVHLLTSFASKPPLEIASIKQLPVAFSGLKRNGSQGRVTGALEGAGRIRMRTRIRHLLGPYTLSSSARKLHEMALKIKPDLVHAMRIPFEGMVAAKADLPFTLIVSVWGNDFTLHGSATSKMRSMTKMVLQRTDALHVDCYRDLRLAEEWGYPKDQRAVVLPAAGGVVPEFFHPSNDGDEIHSLTLQGRALDIPTDAPVVVNPRGFRAYIRNDTFFKSIPLILEQLENSIFLCPAMKDVGEAEKWVSELGIEASVHLLPKLTAGEMGQVFRRAQVSVSPSEHDGTPNTLLEAMASGCFPIASDLESIREWIQDEETGLLIDPSNPSELAKAVVSAFRQPNLVSEARIKNIEVVNNRALRSDVMSKAEEFYQEII